MGKYTNINRETGKQLQDKILIPVDEVNELREAINRFKQAVNKLKWNIKFEWVIDDEQDD